MTFGSVTSSGMFALNMDSVHKICNIIIRVAVRVNQHSFTNFEHTLAAMAHIPLKINSKYGLQETTKPAQVSRCNNCERVTCFQELQSLFC